MIGMVHWAAFVPAAVLVAAAPGANQLLALRNGFRYGPGAAIGASAGRFAAFALMVVAVAAGLGALLAASAVVFAVLKWCGVAYLGWLGLRTIRTAGRGPEDGGAAADGASAWRLARQEFVVAAANPKALILFTVFLPQFVAAPGDGAAGGAAAGGGVAGALLALGAAYIAVEFGCACCYAAAGGRLGALALGRRVRRWVDVAAGSVMLGLAGWLAAEPAPGR
ncbi:LysE family translocator [Actinomadura yumaensis]|uniref:LysE family translocator n=1 Tax=Actinomadura yumaensis TaxID=111807 RepID=A0ABW2D1P5_9ACTN